MRGYEATGALRDIARALDIPQDDVSVDDLYEQILETIEERSSLIADLEGQVVFFAARTALQPKEEAEDFANARLMASAPELLESCEALASLLEKFHTRTPYVFTNLFSGGPSSELEKAKSIIAKANGEG